MFADNELPQCWLRDHLHVGYKCLCFVLVCQLSFHTEQFKSMPFQNISMESNVFFYIFKQSYSIFISGWAIILTGKKFPSKEDFKMILKL